MALVALIAGVALLAGLLIGTWRAGSGAEIVQCGDGIAVCPPDDGRSVLVRIHGRWYVAGYGARTGWGGGEFPAGQWPDAWIELPEEARDR